MPKIIHKIKIEDFRSFDNETVDFNDVACIIGPNEGGKTNLLDAVNMLMSGDESDENDKRIIRTSDIRKNSLKFREGKLPKLEFELSEQVIQDQRLRKIFQIQKNSTITLLRDGNNFYPQLEPKLPNDNILLGNLTEEDIEIKNEEETIKIEGSDWTLINKKDYELLKTQIDQLVSSGKVELNDESNIIEAIKEYLQIEIDYNLNVFFWGYDKQKYGLPDIVNIQEFLKKPTDRIAVLSIFRLARYDQEQIPGIFENKTETDYENIFNEISNKVTEEIRKAWPPNPDIEINITYKTDHLLINIKEPGYSIEPKYRSEGLQWFLAFLIGILAQAKEIKDYIVLIDEPALHLHPGGQKAVLSLINELATNNQIIYSTHSPFMVDKRFPERVRFLIKDTKTGYSLTKAEKPTKENILRDPLLRQALGYTVTDLSYLSEQNILVEGHLEKKALETVVNKFIKEEKIDETIDLNNTGLIDCSGAGEIAKHAKLYKNSGLFCISVYDFDQPGKSAKIANIQNKVQLEEEIISVDQINKSFKTMEDLLPKEVYIKSIKEYFKLKSEDKINDTEKIPRIEKLDNLIEQRIKSKQIQVEEQKEEKRKIKREFEDCLIKNLDDFLGKNNVDEVKDLIELHNLIKKKISEFLEKNKNKK
ncbi:ATP-binding protein [Patescibacteria group bacterium]|nr:ATP-binding protein [Patescibacteria group bacterium]